MGTNNFDDHTTSLLSTVDNGIPFNSGNNTTTEQLLPTAEGLIRLRELYISQQQEEEEFIKEEQEQLTDSNKDETISKFLQESLHSFQFSSNACSTMTIRQELLRKKKRFHGTLPGHHKFNNRTLESSKRPNKTKTVGSPISTHQFSRKKKQTTCYLPSLSESPPTTATQDTSRTMSNSSSLSSHTSSTPPTTEDGDDDEENYYYEEGEEEEEEQPIPHLHNRLKQQNQAILTTYDDWRIILTNSIAQDVLVSHLHQQMNQEQDMLLVGKSVMDLVASSYRNRLKSLIVKKRNELLTAEEDQKSSNGGGMVLVCGNVVPVIKLDGTKSSASLWLKEKVNQDRSSVFIWIFEEVYESSFSIFVSNQGIITSIMDEQGIQDLWDYNTQNDLINKPLNILIPSLQLNNNWKQQIQQGRFFGSHTKRGAQFPIIARLTEETVQITSMPMIAGLMTISNQGIIEGCNDIFVKYLFGFSQQDLLKRHISQLLPQFPLLFKNLKRDDLLQPGLIINNIICRKLLQQEDPSMLVHSSQQRHMNEEEKSKKLTHTPNNQPLPILMAIHRDGTPLEVQLQLKLVETSDNNLHEEYALWISFDRELALKRYGHQHLISSSSSVTPQEKEKTRNSLVYSPTLTVIPLQKEEKKVQQMRSPTVISTSCDTNTIKKDSVLFAPPPPPPSNTLSYGSKQQTKIITSPPPLISRKSYIGEEEDDGEDITYSAQTHSTSIDDYQILSDLGAGAYGLVKLAVKKNDPSQKKVVIKYVIKSRILVDCWTRDRKLGTVPVEIHILHTLKKSPHENLGDMLDYFEDADYYYIVMGLHGEGMDLFDYIELNDQISEPDIRRMFKQIALGVQHLHNNKVVHRDIKDENVVLDQERGGLRLIDFGSAAYLKPNRKYETFVGTLDYAAPEILRGHTYSGKPQDVWALGILLFTLVYRENPFYDIDEIMGRELRIPFVLSEGSVDLIRKMLNRDVDKRIDIHQVLAHPWLN